VGNLIKFIKEKNLRKTNFFGEKGIIFSLFIFFLFSINIHGSENFYTYYNNSLEYMKKGDYDRAIEELKSAISLEFEDTKMKRTYGTRFIRYFPHRELGICYYHIGDMENALKELKLSIGYKKSKRALKYIKLIEEGKQPPNIASHTIQKIKIKEPKTEKKSAKKEKKKTTKKKKSTAPKYYYSHKKVPVGALTYDPNKVTQVGSRLSIAVLPFTVTGKYEDMASSFTDKMITQLVDLHRFRVIERNALENVMKEQSFGMSGMVDDKTAVKAGKLVGADVIVLGSVVVKQGYGKVYARLINTETGELIVAKETNSKYTSISNIEKLVENAAIEIYNELPLVEGNIVNIDDDTCYLDIGSEQGIRKGTKCILFREGAEIVHPVTKEVLGRKVTKLGEAIVYQVQPKLSMARILYKEKDIKNGDKIVVK
jgi:TolB-like protein